METFSRAALAPADITNIMIDRESFTIDVVVEEDQLSLAIGRRGQNTRLAAMLTGYKVNIISKSKLQEKIKRSVENLIQIPSVADTTAQILVQSGIQAIGDLAAIEPAELVRILDITEEEGKKIVSDTLDAIEEGKIELQPEEDELIAASAVPPYTGILEKAQESEKDQKDKFSEAERRLREELASFKLK